jgi:hypothetical protein
MKNYQGHLTYQNLGEWTIVKWEMKEAQTVDLEEEEKKT